MIDGLPRRNGELAFDAPWQSRAFGLAAGVVDSRFDGDWEPFRQRLIATIAARPGLPYWEAWTVALEDLVVGSGLLPQSAVDERAGGSR